MAILAALRVGTGRSAGPSRPSKMEVDAIKNDRISWMLRFRVCCGEAQETMFLVV